MTAIQQAYLNGIKRAQSDFGGIPVLPGTKVETALDARSTADKLKDLTQPPVSKYQTPYLAPKKPKSFLTDPRALSDLKDKVIGFAKENPGLTGGVGGASAGLILANLMNTDEDDEESRSANRRRALLMAALGGGLGVVGGHMMSQPKTPVA